MIHCPPYQNQICPECCGSGQRFASTCGHAYCRQHGYWSTCWRCAGSGVIPAFVPVYSPQRYPQPYPPPPYRGSARADLRRARI